MGDWLREYARFLTTDVRWWVLPCLGWIALLLAVAFVVEVAQPSFVYPIF